MAADAPPIAADGPVKALLFDFGNVLVPIDFGLMAASWARSAGREASDIRDRWAFDDAYKAYERDQIGLGEYFSHLRRTLEVDLDDAALLAGWNAIFLEPDPRTVPLLQELSRRWPLYLFSNTNRAHQAFWSFRYARMLEPLTEVFTSCELGARKPEAEGFRRVAERIGVAPGEILFFDDLEENVEGARRAGLQAFVATGPDDIRRALS